VLVLSSRRDEKGDNLPILLQWFDTELAVDDATSEIWVKIGVGVVERLHVGLEIHGGGEPGHGDGGGRGGGGCSIRREIEVVFERRAARLID
jgi:hypothetical protein